jgi:hypothetical protein
VNPLVINPKLRTELITVLVGSGSGNEIPLGIIENLRNAKYIKKIETFHAGQISNAPDGTPVVDLAIFQKSFLGLQNSTGTEFQKLTPLVNFSKIANGTVIPDVNLPTLDSQKCIIKIANGTASPVGLCYLFLITYEKP